MLELTYLEHGFNSLDAIMMDFMPYNWDFYEESQNLP